VRLALPHRYASALRQRLGDWLFRTGSAATADVVLVQRRVFILPTRQGLVFGGTLVLMLAASVNYNLSLGYVLTFLLAAMGLNAMLHTYRNLANLKIAAAGAQPVYAGERARFMVDIANAGAHARYAIGLTRDRQDAAYVDIPAGESRLAGSLVDAPRRGLLHPGRLTLYTHYPLGLYRAWSYLELDMHCIVYPRPEPPGIPLPLAAAAHRNGDAWGTGEEDFGGLRPYHAGDPPRHIAWKASARDDLRLLTKQFTGRAAAQCWLDWHALPARLGVEDKLSRLARWVLDAHTGGLAYGLRLPSLTLPPASGEAHRARCLEALALFEPHDADRSRTQA